MGWPEIVRQAEASQRWELLIHKVCGEAAEEIISEAHRKAIYQGGSIPNRLAEAYADAIQQGLNVDP